MAASHSKGPSKRRNRLLYPLYLILVVLIAGEVVVRVMGYLPWEPAQQTFSVKPGGPFFRPDSLLGYAGRPGSFEVTLDGKLEYTVTHDPAGFRITGEADRDGADTLNRPEVWIFGCSFTHGFGVNDQETYPWKVQERLPACKIRNFAMDGYGTLQSLLSLQHELKHRPRPVMVVLTYGAFHDQRNTSNRYWRKVLYGREVVADLQYPQIRFNKHDSLEMSSSHLEYRPFPLMRYSALSHALEQAWNRQQDGRLRSREITRLLIGRFVETCKENEVSVLLAGIYQHPETKEMLSHFAKKGISTLDISQDLDREDLRILPEDGHPNPKAHALMAELLATWLENTLPLPQ